MKAHATRNGVIENVGVRKLCLTQVVHTRFNDVLRESVCRTSRHCSGNCAHAFGNTCNFNVASAVTNAAHFYANTAKSAFSVWWRQHWQSSG
jgi:hypothetical protein